MLKSNFVRNLIVGVVLCALFVAFAFMGGKLTQLNASPVEVRNANAKAVRDADQSADAADRAAVSARKAADSTRATAEAAENSARDAANSAKDSAAIANSGKK